MKPPKMDKERREWLAGLKVGDEVAWTTEVMPVRIVKIAGVSRSEPPDFVVDNETEKNSHCRGKFTQKTGKGRVGTFRPTNGWIVPVTEDHRRSHRVEEARQRLGSISFNRFAPKFCPPDEKILAIAAILWPEEFGGGK